MLGKPAPTGARNFTKRLASVDLRSGDLGDAQGRLDVPVVAAFDPPDGREPRPGEYPVQQPHPIQVGGAGYDVCLPRKATWSRGDRMARVAEQIGVVEPALAEQALGSIASQPLSPKSTILP